MTIARLTALFMLAAGFATAVVLHQAFPGSPEPLLDRLTLSTALEMVFMTLLGLALAFTTVCPSNRVPSRLIPPGAIPTVFATGNGLLLVYATVDAFDGLVMIPPGHWVLAAGELAKLSGLVLLLGATGYWLRGLLQAQDDRERRLREREEWFRTLFETYPDGTLLVDPENGRPLYFNRHAHEKLGYTAEEFARLRISDFEDQQTPERARERMSTILEQGRDEFETRNRCKDGSVIDVRVTVLPLTLEGRTLLLAVFRDISASKQAWRDLAESEKRFLDVATAAGEYIWEIDAEGRYRFVTPQAESLLGYTTDAIIGHSPYEFMPEEESRRVRGMLKEWAAGKSSWRDLEHVSVRPDGTLVHQRVSGLPILDESGELLGFRGTGRDITAEKEAERVQHALTERLHLATSAADLGIWDYDIATGRLDWDAGMFRLYGVEPADFGHHLEDWDRTLMPESRDRAVSRFLGAVENGNAFEAEFAIRRADGGGVRTLHSQGQVIRNDAGETERVIGINQDISGIKQAQRASDEARQVAEAANRAKSEFLANMSHEIRTPMNAVIGLSQLLRQTNLDETQQDYLDKIHHSSRMLLGILNDILDLSKIESGQLELEARAFDIYTVVDQVTMMFGETVHTRQIEFLHNIQPDLPSCLIGDSLRLSQVLTNLLSNAFKFTDDGGVVELGIHSSGPLHDGRVSLRFSVRDTGIGMSEEQLARLFQPFSQADSSTTRRYGGTGLGLIISQRLVEAMGGELQVASTLGEGSTFHFTVELPVDHGTCETISCPATRGRRVLIVDDQEEARAVLRQLLLHCNFVTAEVASGEAAIEAVAAAEQRDEPFDFILMDWMMPGGMTGTETCETLEQMRRRGELQKTRPPILMVSAHQWDEATLPEDLATDFLAKPVNASTLYDALMRAETGETRVRHRSTNGGRPPNLVGRNLLLVEDNAINQEVARLLLEPTGARLRLAENGSEAVDAARDQAPDLILMDLQMPVMDGFEATRTLRDEGYTGPIVALSAAVMEDDRRHATEAGMDAHMGKPIDSEQLYALLQQLLVAEESAAMSSVEPSAPAPVEPDDAPPPEETKPLPDHLPGFDLKRGRYQLAGNEALYVRLLKDLRGKLGNDYASIVDALRRGDTELARRMAHTLKGSAGTLAAVDLERLAEEINDTLKKGHVVEDHRIDALQQALNHAEQTLAVLESNHQTAPPRGTADAIATLRSHLVNSELIDETTLQEALAWLRDQGHDCDPLEAQVAQLEFEDALQTLDAMRTPNRGATP